MSKSWKEQLLSSGFPLEYQVQETLIKAGFNVDGEFVYTKMGRESEDFSVDIEADYFIPIDETDNDNYIGTLDLVCECKYRRQNKAWLFIPDTNDPDFSPAMPMSIRTFPYFCAYEYESKPIILFSYAITSVLKGIEVEISGGEAHSTDIRHAINQLRYALPRMILKNIQKASHVHLDDARPFFILPLLVTNAPLYVLREDLSMPDFEAAENLESIADKVECVDLHSPYSEAFASHSAKKFSDWGLESLMSSKNFRYLQKVDAESGVKYFSPHLEFARLSSESDLRSSYFKQFLVVNSAYLPQLIEKVKATLSEALKGTSKKVLKKKAMS